MGSPSRVKPHGTEAAGSPVMLKGNVNALDASRETGVPSIVLG